MTSRSPDNKQTMRIRDALVNGDPEGLASSFLTLAAPGGLSGFDRVASGVAAGFLDRYDRDNGSFEKMTERITSAYSWRLGASMIRDAMSAFISSDQLRDPEKRAQRAARTVCDYIADLDRDSGQAEHIADALVFGVAGTSPENIRKTGAGVKPPPPETGPPPGGGEACPAPVGAPSAESVPDTTRGQDANSAVPGEESVRMLRVDLYPSRNPADPAPGVLRLPAALPPPPSVGPGVDHSAWLSGQPASETSYGVRAGILDTGDQGDLMEIESELHDDPAAALATYGARTPVEDAHAGAAWCARLGRDLGAYLNRHDQAAEALADALRRALEKGDPDLVVPLRSAGATLNVPEPLAEAICGMMDAEAVFLEDGPADNAGPAQNLAGSLSPDADLSRPCTLDRAVTLHLSASVPLGDALQQAITEFRCAQGVRALGADATPQVNARFDQDPGLRFDELVGVMSRDPDPENM